MDTPTPNMQVVLPGSPELFPVELFLWGPDKSLVIFADGDTLRVSTANLRPL